MSAPVASAPDGGGRYLLTAEKLEAYIAYREAQAVRPAVQAGPDGGVSLAALSRYVRAEEEAREKSRLTEEDLEQILPLVADVLRRRERLRASASEADAEAWAPVRDHLPANARAELDRAQAQLQEEREVAGRLVEERRTYGDANVELVLKHEERLVKMQNLWLYGVTGAPPAR